MRQHAAESSGRALDILTFAPLPFPTGSLFLRQESWACSRFPSSGRPGFGLFEALLPRPRGGLSLRFTNRNGDPDFRRTSSPYAKKPCAARKGAEGIVVRGRVYIARWLGLFIGVTLSVLRAFRPSACLGRRSRNPAPSERSRGDSLDDYERRPKGKNNIEEKDLP
ncbi:unnamed protein product [Victoria cruziana]